MPPGHPLPSSTITALIRPERLASLLEPWLPDAEDRAFVARCIVAEGPIHHRGASFALLSMLGLLLEATGPVERASKGPTIPVQLRLPPHLAPRDDDHRYPLGMPAAPIERLAARGSPEFNALVDCLLDGPPHHALANAAMVCLLDALFARICRPAGNGGA